MINQMIAILVFGLVACKSLKNQTQQIDNQTYIQNYDLNWILKNQTTDFMIKFFKYGLLTNINTNKIDIECVMKYKSLFYDNAKLFNDLENIEEPISIDKYCSVLTDFCLDKKYEIYYNETITNEFINNQLTKEINNTKIESDSSYKLKIPFEKWTNQYFSKEKSNFLTFEFPKKTSYNLTIYNNPINHEVFIINIEKKQ